MFNHKSATNIGLILFGSLFLINSASANIGKVLLAVGEVSAKREQLVKLSRGDILIEKDIVVTGKKGRAQLFMVDGAKIAVKPSSELSLEKYQYNKQPENVVGTSESSMTMSLIKGGFRTISGAIGSGEDKSDYKVKTPIATIGIRGTDYSALICGTSCAALSGSGNVAGGVYFGVSKGSIVIKNDGGELVLEMNQFGYVAGNNNPPKRITAPPKDLMSDPADPIIDEEQTTDEPAKETQVAVIDSDTPGSDEGIKNDEPAVGSKEITGDTEPDLIVPVDGDDGGDNLIRIDNNVYDFSNARSIAYSGSFNTTNGFSIVTDTPFESLTENAGGLTEFYALSANGEIGSEYLLSSAQAYNVGFDPESGISWGRWSDGFMQTVADNGDTQQIDLSTSSFHWAIDNTESGQALPVNGTASYSLIGNTDPTNNSGQTGLLGSAAFFVDFTNQSVDTSVNLGIGEQVWSASGSGSIADGTHWFAGLYDEVLINGEAGGGGNFTGFFSNQLDATGLPAGVGLVYNLFDNINDPSHIINGTLIFGTPKP